MLNDWINPDVISNVEKLNSEFVNCEPFNYISIDNFLVREKFEKLKQVCENQEFYVEDHDLYRFSRTVDYKNSKDEFILEYRQFLKSEEFISFMEKLSSIELDRKKMDLHSLRFENTNYLLCHDDEVQSRAIAFILNFTDMKKEEGGALEIYDNENNKPTKIIDSIYPKENKFNFFKVTPGKSFHQVEEVLVDKQRNSISGWYYFK